MVKFIDPYVLRENLFLELRHKITDLFKKIEVMHAIKPSPRIEKARLALKNCLDKIVAREILEKDEKTGHKKNPFTIENQSYFFEALDFALEQEGWDSSSFLTQVGNRLRTIRDDFEKQWETQTKEEGAFQFTKEHHDRPEMKKVYIALYSSKGGDLSAWESIISNLPMNVVSRPVYEDEEKIVTALRNTENPANVAYIGIFVKKSGFLELPSDKKPVDRYGNVLQSLKNNAIHLDDIDCFVHALHSYRYIQGRLVRC